MREEDIATGPALDLLHPYGDVIASLRVMVLSIERDRDEARNRLSRMRDAVEVVQESIARLSARASEYHRVIKLLEAKVAPGAKSEAPHAEPAE